MSNIFVYSVGQVKGLDFALIKTAEFKSGVIANIYLLQSRVEINIFKKYLMEGRPAHNEKEYKKLYNETHGDYLLKLHTVTRQQLNSHFLDI